MLGFLKHFSYIRIEAVGFPTFRLLLYANYSGASRYR